MKESIVDLMLTMMPLMKPFMWVGVGISGVGILLILMKYLFKSDMRSARKWTTALVFVAAIFFISAQIAGYLLNMTPAINFGDSSQFEFILVSFWKIGVGFLVISLLLKFVGNARTA